MVDVVMDTLAEQLNTKLQEWQPDIVNQVWQLIAEIIDLADQDALDILRLKGISSDVKPKNYFFEDS